MKFLVDAQLPPGLCRWLEAQGHEALHVSELSEEPMRDREIADYAEREGAIVITKDDDFTTLRLPDRFQLLWLRCGNFSNRRLRAWLWEQWDEVEARLERGARFVTLE
jgi:predicted nuclease of predicted toxin-antitoxin system